MRLSILLTLPLVVLANESHLRKRIPNDDDKKPALEEMTPNETQEAREREEQAKNHLIESRIVGGQTAPDGSFEWFVRWGTGRCGASLIHADILLSAAHCNVRTDGRVRIRGGDIERNIVRRRIHPHYNADFYQNDFLVLKLDQPVDGIQPIRLNNDGRRPGQNDTLVVMGHGRTSDSAASNQLIQATAHYVNAETCNAPDIYNGLVADELMFCAGPTLDHGDYVGPCQGDSGGPAVDLAAAASQPLQVGIVSWGAGCNRATHPAVYARVSSAYDWIQEKICELSDRKPTGCPAPPVNARRIRIDIVHGSTPFETSWSLLRVLEDSIAEVLEWPEQSLWQSGLVSDVVYLLPGAYTLTISGGVSDVAIYLSPDGMDSPDDDLLLGESNENMDGVLGRLIIPFHVPVENSPVPSFSTSLPPSHFTSTPSLGGALLGDIPSGRPSNGPSESISEAPSFNPTNRASSDSPTASPSETTAPPTSVSAEPSLVPSGFSTLTSSFPSIPPSRTAGSGSPSWRPTDEFAATSTTPSESPTDFETPAPSGASSTFPSQHPSSYPSLTSFQSMQPSATDESGSPSWGPTEFVASPTTLSDSPSSRHTSLPSERSQAPSEISGRPSTSPTVGRSNAPSEFASGSPSETPTSAPFLIEPSTSPSMLGVSPSTSPTSQPTALPSDGPSQKPSLMVSTAQSSPPSGASSSSTPSDAPSSLLATSLPPSSTVCADNESFVFIAGPWVRDCEFVARRPYRRKRYYCGLSGVRSNCPLACDDCLLDVMDKSEECEDHQDELVVVDNRHRTCAWLVGKDYLIERACREGRDAFFACRKTCGLCDQS